MQLKGRCYCGELRYEVEGDPVIKGQCHCRECQYVSGGGPNFIFGFREKGFAYTTGQPASFSRSDLDSPVTREFCAKCGTHILSRVPTIPGVVILWPLVLWRWVQLETGRDRPLARHRPPRGFHKFAWIVFAALIPAILVTGLLVRQDGPWERPSVRLEAPK